MASVMLSNGRVQVYGLTLSDGWRWCTDGCNGPLMVCMVVNDGWRRFIKWFAVVDEWFANDWYIVDE